LFASDAVYHINCRARFAKNLPHTPHKRKRGRPVNEEAMSAFDMLCDKLENETENDLNTLSEMHAIMCQLAGLDSQDSVYTEGYLRHLLKCRYGDHIYFSSSSGRADVIGFENFCQLIIHNKYFADKSEGCGS
jgi:hypothetical protein